MKKAFVILIGLSMVAFIACNEKKADIPEAVDSAFKAKFPDVTDVNWENEENMWEASFKDGDKTMEVCFNEVGEWMETETAVQAEALPAGVMDSLMAMYPDYEVEEIEAVEKPDFKGFEVELVMAKDGEEEELEIMITETGEFVNMEEEMETDEDEKDAESLITDDEDTDEGEEKETIEEETMKEKETIQE